MENEDKLDKLKKIITSVIEGQPEDMQESFTIKMGEDIIKKYSKLEVSQNEISIPEIEDVSKKELEYLKKELEIIIFTAADVEKAAVLRYMNPLKSRRCIIKGHVKYETYYIGIIGVYNVVLVMCKMGSVQKDSISLVSRDAYDFWEPEIAILCGIAFGLKKKKQSIGDIIIAEEIKPDDVLRAGKKTIPRGISESCDLTLKNRFKNEINWRYPLSKKRVAKIHIGQVISGENLVDNKKLVKKLKKMYPNAIGGDMEGAGFSAAASRKEIRWIFVKAICDWGYNKTKEYQKIAAESSISLVRSVFNDPYVFEELNISPALLENKDTTIIDYE